jgi:hypothetical protein
MGALAALGLRFPNYAKVTLVIFRKKKSADAAKTGALDRIKSLVLKS